MTQAHQKYAADLEDPNQHESLSFDSEVQDQDDICDLTGTRIPHINVHVFRETDAFAQTWQRTLTDRRMQNATTTIHENGFVGAIKKYAVEPTPALIVVETDTDADTLEFQADALAEVCDPGTELIVIGHRNDIQLYQKLMAMGVSNYLVYPVTVSSIISAIDQVYREPTQGRVGRIHAVLGAKGGVGASTVAQNLALEMAESTHSEVLLIDLDLNFGTAALNLDLDANQGLREIIEQSENVNGPMLDRVLLKRGRYLNLLGAMPDLVNNRDMDSASIARLLEAATAHMSNVVLDLPHAWSPWVQTALSTADRIMVVSTPEIGALRNASAMITQLKGNRPNDKPPVLVLNQSGLPGRQEITPREIHSVLGMTPEVAIPFDAKTLSRAASTGKMLRDVSPRRPITRRIGELSASLDRRSAQKADKPTRKRSLFRIGRSE